MSEQTPEKIQESQQFIKDFVEYTSAMFSKRHSQKSCPEAERQKIGMYFNFIVNLAEGAGLVPEEEA